MMARQVAIFLQQQRQSLVAELDAAAIFGFRDSVGIKHERVAGVQSRPAPPVRLAALRARAPDAWAPSRSIAPPSRRNIGGQCPALTYSSTLPVRFKHAVEERDVMALADLVPQNRFDLADDRCRSRPDIARVLTEACSMAAISAPGVPLPETSAMQKCKDSGVGCQTPK